MPRCYKLNGYNVMGAKIEAWAVGASAVMLVLRICQVIDWPWYVVCGPAMAVITYYAIGLIIASVLAMMVSAKKHSGNRR